jgi:hypothetical protein
MIAAVTRMPLARSSLDVEVPGWLLAAGGGQQRYDSEADWTVPSCCPGTATGAVEPLP